MIRPLSIILLLVLMLSASGLAAADNEWLSVKLEQLRVQHGLPGMAAAAVRDGEVVISAATGLRKLGSPERVTVADKWHIGSCTKSMTSTLAGHSCGRRCDPMAEHDRRDLPGMA